MPYLAGVLALFVLWLLIGLSSGFRAGQLVVGADGRPSTSKFQLILWTAAAVFAYVALEALRFREHVFAPMLTVPTNLLIAMGISGGTAVTAKAIAVNQNPQTPVTALPTTSAAGDGSVPESQAQVTTAATAKVSAEMLQSDVSGILQGVDGKPDLGKLQIVVWSGFALAVFLGRVLHAVHTHGLEMPDIDETQMVLMGIGHGTYLGKKIVSN